MKLGSEQGAETTRVVDVLNALEQGDLKTITEADPVAWKKAQAIFLERQALAAQQEKREKEARMREELLRDAQARVLTLPDTDLLRFPPTLK
jgi:hypothetical protein